MAESSVSEKCPHGREKPIRCYFCEPIGTFQRERRPGQRYNAAPNRQQMRDEAEQFASDMDR